MSVILKIRRAVIVDGNVIEGSLIADTTLTLPNGEYYSVRDKVIADNYTEDDLWITGDGGMDSYTYGFIISTEDLFVQLRNTDTGVVEYVRIEVKANVLTPLPNRVGGTTDDRLDGAQLTENADWAPVDKIEVQRNVADGIGDAIVSLHLFN